MGGELPSTAWQDCYPALGTQSSASIISIHRRRRSADLALAAGRRHRPRRCQLPGTWWMAGKNISRQLAGRALMLPTSFMNSAYFMRFSGDVV